MKLSDLQNGQSGQVVKVLGSGNFRKRIIEMGFVRGKQVEVLQGAPLRDPVKYKLMDFEVSLHRSEAALIEVLSADEARNQRNQHTDLQGAVEEPAVIEHIAGEKSHRINIALVGNPNCGKTSLYNKLSGAHEHTGNYSGITVNAQQTEFDYQGYHLILTDLPGSYSLSAASSEELDVRRHILNNQPDLIINVVAASNLERNLYLSTQLIDMDIPMVIALNMYDELEKNGDRFKHQDLANMLGIPIVPIISKAGISDTTSTNTLLDAVIDVYEGKSHFLRHIHINHGGDLQEAIDRLTVLIKQDPQFDNVVSARFFATKIMEKDAGAEAYVRGLKNGANILQYRNEAVLHIENELGEDGASAVINAKYGFVAGALAETYKPGNKDAFLLSEKIDRLVTHRIWGYPIFFLFMGLMFACTFKLGAYPQDWIAQGVDALIYWLRGLLTAGPLTNLLLDGCISGVGAVLSFLPNILILFFFLALMEDSGYLSRAAFLMDRIMHSFGLHGQSFIPMLTGFGCNVPAVMATRTLGSRSARLITMLIIPFMSCSARIPAYVLISAAFFPKHAALVMMGLYFSGILIAMLTAQLLHHTVLKNNDMPFVMELPPYRIPTIKTALHHMWEKSVHYLRKMGTVILTASVIVWALGYFPLQKDGQSLEQQRENSYIGRIGKALEPVVEPLGLDWRMGVSILTALPAKEFAVSTLAVLYTGQEAEEGSGTLVSALQNDPTLTPLKGLVYMLFLLLCFPCLATLAAIKAESGSWKWPLFSMVYSCSIAWLLCFAVYQLGSLLT